MPEPDLETRLRGEISLRVQECATFRADIAWWAGVTAGQQAELKRLDAEGWALQAEIRGAEAVARALYNSTSWRFAAPLRALSNAVRRLTGQPVAALATAPPAQAAAAVPARARVPLAPAAAPVAPRRGTMLVAADSLPLFDQSSGGLRLKTLIGLLHASGWSIAFASAAGLDAQPVGLRSAERRARYEAALHDAGVQRILYGLHETAAFLGGPGNAIAYAFLSFPGVAASITPLVRRHTPTARVVYDMVDFHGLRMAREAALRDDAALRDKANRQRDLELACARAADVTLAVTDEERAALLDLAPDLVVETLPNVFEVPTTPAPGVEGRANLLFVGGFWHAPNGDAMEWFVERIWPTIRRELPEARLRIAGANPENEVLALGLHDGVDVLGFVPDLGPLYRAHRVFIAPLRYGAGMKGKVGQSLMLGLPVVTTSVGAEGMGLQDGVHVLIAEEEAAFAAQVLRLMRDDLLWYHLAAKGRAHVESTLSVGVVRSRLEAIFVG